MHERTKAISSKGFDSPEPRADERDATGGVGPGISPGRIAQRAYQIYCERSGEHGRDTDDWFRAEMELNNTPS